MTWPQIQSPSQSNDLTLSRAFYRGPVPAMVDYQGATYVLNQGVTRAFTSPGTWGPIGVMTRGCTGASGRVSSPACL